MAHGESVLIRLGKENIITEVRRLCRDLQALGGEVKIPSRKDLKIFNDSQLVSMYTNFSMKLDAEEKKEKFLVKFSGDLVEKDSFYKMLKKEYADAILDIIPGAGMQTYELCKRKKIRFKIVGPPGFRRRKVFLKEDRKEIHEEGIRVQKIVREKLKQFGIKAEIIPLHFKTRNDYHTENGDLKAMSLAHNYDHVVVYTLQKKKPEVTKFRIKVIRFK
ncbi:MAG: hypothetical protein NTZ97_04195 [Candidatus Moranbacteria bacterium]|nr:hypothetical protein [Candidatus Moranbacteria bacterium]